MLSKCELCPCWSFRAQPSRSVAVQRALSVPQGAWRLYSAACCPLLAEPGGAGGRCPDRRKGSLGGHHLCEGCETSQVDGHQAGVATSPMHPGAGQQPGSEAGDQPSQPSLSSSPLLSQVAPGPGLPCRPAAGCQLTCVCLVLCDSSAESFLNRSSSSRYLSRLCVALRRNVAKKRG